MWTVSKLLSALESPASTKENMMTALPLDSQARKDVPLARGVLDYFPAALAAVAKLSKAGNDKHNPGEVMHHARGKSSDHADCIMRHLSDRGTVDTDGFLHEVKVAWRALAMLQEALETRGAPMAPGARAAGWVETPETGRMVPVITGSTEGTLYCANEIDQRIAGCEARGVKNEYYLGCRFPVGTEVVCAGYRGTVVSHEEAQLDHGAGYAISTDHTPVRYHTRGDGTKIDFPFIDVDPDEELDFA